MERLGFDNYEDFACKIADDFDLLTDEFGDIAIVAKYKETKEIIRELACFDYSIESVNINRPNWDDYYDEYLISLNFDGIWCEPMKRGNGYITDNSSIIYILDNCSSKVIPYCKGEIVYEVNVGENDEYDCDECGLNECVCHKEYDKPEKYVEYSKDNNGNMHGFSASKSDGNLFYAYSVYTSNDLSMKDIQSLLQEAGF